jgi:hypothetical protein
VVVKLLKNEIAIAISQRISESLISAETRVDESGSQWSSTHRRIGSSRAKSLVHEFAISEFLRGPGSLITTGIRGTRSRRVGVRHVSGFSHTKGITAGEINFLKRDDPTVTPFRRRTGVRRSVLVGSDNRWHQHLVRSEVRELEPQRFASKFARS